MTVASARPPMSGRRGTPIGRRVDRLGLGYSPGVSLPSVTVQSLSENASLVTIVGEQDHATAPEVQQALAEAAVNGEVIVVDMTETTFIDSTIIGAIVSAPGEPIVITSEGSHPRHVLRLVEAGHVVRLVDSRADALRLLDS